MFQMVTIPTLLEISKLSKDQQMWKWPKIPNDHVTLLFSKSTILKWQTMWPNMNHVVTGNDLKHQMTRNTKWPETPNDPMIIHFIIKYG